MTETEKRNVIDEAEKFISLVRGRDLIVTDSGLRMRYKASWGKEMAEQPYSEFLPARIAEYMHAKQEEKEHHAIDLLVWIDRGNLNGYLGVGDGMVRKLAEAQAENQVLRKALEDVTKERDGFKHMYEECDSGRKGGSFISDVQSS